jgi:hypothetical protein
MCEDSKLATPRHLLQLLLPVLLGVPCHPYKRASTLAHVVQNTEGVADYFRVVSNDTTIPPCCPY